jgi:hypothetical protein
MLVTTVTEDGRVEVVVDGGIDAAAMTDLREAVERESDRSGPVRLLVEVRSLGGVTPAALREDLRSLHLVSRIHRYALVTDIGWIRKAAPVEFALLPIEGRVFDDRAEAVAWLAA